VSAVMSRLRRSPLESARRALRRPGAGRA
jgi:hypothetical protein